MLMAQAAVDRFGHIDILCSNAGIFPATPLRDMTAADIDTVLDTNLRGTMLSVRACIPAMEKAGKGRVIITSSITGPITVHVAAMAEDGEPIPEFKSGALLHRSRRACIETAVVMSHRGSNLCPSAIAPEVAASRRWWSGRLSEKAPRSSLDGRSRRLRLSRAVGSDDGCQQDEHEQAPLLFSAPGESDHHQAQQERNDGPDRHRRVRLRPAQHGKEEE
jgi:NAD(P)-dependent dehydrogenase (short-subunit alcohol dehydrogenase family)